MSEFSTRLRDARKRLGLSQEEFAAAGGVKLNAQSNYENGHRVPDVTYLERVAALGVDVGRLVTGQQVGAGLTEDEAELLRAYAGADEVAREALRVLATRVAGTVAIGRKGEG